MHIVIPTFATMAFQQMLSGSECAAPNNLRQFMKHMQADRTLQQDTMQPGRPASHAFRTANLGGGAVPEMDAFMQQGAPGFDMSGMRGEMDAIRGGMVARPGVPSGAAWANEMRAAPGPAPATHAGGWSDQFVARPVGPAGPANPMAAGSSGAATIHEAHAGRMPMGMMGMGGMGMSGMGMGMGTRQVAPPRTSVAPGGQRVYELDDAQWEEQFKRLEQEDVQSTRNETDKDEEARLQEFRERLFGDYKDSNPRFEELWNTLKDEESMLGRNHMDELAKWEQTLVDSIREEDPSNYTHPGGGLGLGEEALNETAGIDGTEDRLRKMFTEVGEDGFPKLDAYRPAAQNPYASHPSPYAEGVRLMDNNGSLSEAALLFETAVKRDQEQRPEGLELDNAERSRVWQKLGECQAMNEHELAAIQALEKAVELDGNNLEAYVVRIC